MTAFDLRAHTHLLVLAGSRAYGLHRPGSDVDLRGVAVPPARFFHGYRYRFEQADAPDEMSVFADLLRPEEQVAIAETHLEGSVYNLVKLVRLASEANPNILDVLFCRDEEVRFATPVGHTLRAHRALFLSARCARSFGGYATAQIKRIRGHRSWLTDPPTHQPTRGEFGLPEVTTLSRDQLKAAEVTGGLGLSPEVMDVVVRERRYHGAMNTWRRYRTWQRERNPERAALEAAHGYDTKHGAHLVRLLRMGLEIVRTGGVHVWRGDRDRDELLAIRAGAWPYERLVAWADDRHQELTAHLDRDVAVPAEPDHARLDAMCCALVEEALGIRALEI